MMQCACVAIYSTNLSVDRTAILSTVMSSSARYLSSSLISRNSHIFSNVYPAPIYQSIP